MKAIPITAEQRTEQELMNLTETVKELKKTIKSQTQMIKDLKFDLFKSLNEIKQNQYICMKMNDGGKQSPGNSNSNSKERKNKLRKKSSINNNGKRSSGNIQFDPPSSPSKIEEKEFESSNSKLPDITNINEETKAEISKGQNLRK